MAISPLENDVLGSISVAEPWSLVETFATQPRWRPEDVNKGADVIVARAQALGLPVEVHSPTIFLSIPHEASVSIDGQTFRAKPPALSRPVPEGLTGALLYIKANPKNLRTYSRDIRDVFGESFTDWTDFKSRVGGKILITEGFGNPALTSLVEEMGAIGLIVINPGANIHWGTSSQIWGSPGLEDLSRKPKIPVAAVNKPDGERIKALADGVRKVTIATRLEEGWFEQKVPVVTIPGNEEEDRFVLVHGHYDSWDVGVGDNATGDAVLLGLADVLWRSRKQLRRSVRIAWWPGHSTGRYSGSTWYADAFALDLDAHCVAQVNCDSPGCRWATSYHQTTCMSELHSFITGVIEDVTGTRPQFIRPKRAGDYSFYNVGISSYFMLSSTMPKDLLEEKNYYEVSGCGGNIVWHTEDDTMEIADKNVLETDLKIYALSVLRHASAEILPTDWRATVAEFEQTLKRFKAATGERFDWSKVDAATTSLSKALQALYADIEADNIPARTANDTLMKLARILVPLNYTRTQRFAQDPAVACPALPGLSMATELERPMGDITHHVLTDLLRGANRYIAALQQAEHVVKEART
jgi:N-acetylated-alpha-linked acidic dipeptidase